MSGWTGDLSDAPPPIAGRGPWTCFHCGETFTTPGSAKDHFGFDPSCDPACRIKLGSERGLLMALRKAEADIQELHGLLSDENAEAYRLLASAQTRHIAALNEVEEHAYDLGLREGRARPAPQTVSAQDAAALEGYRAATAWVASDAWDGCSDCIEVLRMAAVFDFERCQTPDETAHILAKLRAYRAGVLFDQAVIASTKEA